MPFADTMICDPLVDTLLSVERAAQYGGGGNSLQTCNENNSGTRYLS